MVFIWSEMFCRPCKMCKGMTTNINKNQRIMKKMKEVYEAPFLEVTEIQVEQCVLIGSYGDEGEPGQDSGYNDPDFDL